MGSDKKKEAFISNSSELYALLKSFREGKDSAFCELVSLYMPLISSMVSESYSGTKTYMEREDLHQYALIAFSRAAMTYDLSQDKVSFGLYAKICIGNALVSGVRSAQRKYVETLPIDGIRNMADPDVSDVVVDRENASRLHSLIVQTLSPFENEVFEHYVQGHSSSDIAAALGKTEKSVDNAIFRARKKLKAVLNEAPKGTL